MAQDPQETQPLPPRRPSGLPSRTVLAAALLGVAVLLFALGASIGAAVAYGLIDVRDCTPSPALAPGPGPALQPARDGDSSMATLRDLHQQQMENAKLKSELQLLKSQQKQESIMALPYLQHFEYGLNYGMVITIKGFVQPKAFRLPVILKNGPAVSEVALLFSPRFETNQMVRNHFSNNSWGPEETTGPVPVKFSQHFHYEIRVLQNMYEIFVDGVHYCDFVHRLPFNKVKYLDIHGDLILTLVTTHQMLL